MIDPSATFGGNVGTGVNSTNTTPATVSVTLTGAVPVGSTLFAAAGERTSAAGSWSAADNHAGTTNTYSVDSEATRNGSGSNDSRVAIIRSSITTALTTSDTVTVTAPVGGNQPRVASLFYFTGVVTTSPLDKTGSANLSNSAPSVSTSAATTEADELVVAAFGQADARTVSSPTCTATTSVSNTSNYTVNPFWKNVSATGVQTCAATYSGSAEWAGAIATYKLTAPTVDHFKVEANGGGNIATQTAGTPFSIQVTAQDASNNTVTSFSGAGNTVNITSNRTCSSGCTTTGTFTNGVLTGYSVTLSQAGTLSTITATRTSGGAQTGTSNTFTVSAGVLDHFALSLASPQTNGVAFTGTNTLTAQDANNNTVTSFDASANNVTMTALAPLTGTVSGIHGSNVLNQAGDFTSGVANLTALGMTYTGNATTGTFRATSANSKVGTSGSVTINAGALDHFKVEANGGGNIATQTAGTPFSIQVTAQDASNNTVTSFSGAGNTVNITSNRTCSSGCTTTGTFTNGVLTGYSVTLSQAGTGSTITATRTSGGAQFGTSNTFTVNAGVLDHFALSLASPQTNGVAFTGTNTLTAQDANNNTVTSFDASANNVTMTALAPLTGTVSGIHGSNVLNQAGDFTSGVANLTALGMTYTGNATTGTFRATSANSKVGTSGSVTINAGALDNFKVEANGGGNIGTQTAGTPFSIQVTARDAIGNTVTASRVRGTRSTSRLTGPARRAARPRGLHQRCADRLFGDVVAGGDALDDHGDAHVGRRPDRDLEHVHGQRGRAEQLPGRGQRWREHRHADGRQRVLDPGDRARLLRQHGHQLLVALATR